MSIFGAIFRSHRHVAHFLYCIGNHLVGQGYNIFFLDIGPVLLVVLSLLYHYHIDLSTRRIAKDMLRKQLKPKNKSQQMIVKVTATTYHTSSNITWM